MDRVLKRFYQISIGNITNSDDEKVAKYIHCAKSLFNSWKYFFNSNYLSNLKNSSHFSNYFCDMLKLYLPERGNGSWNGMERQEANLCSNPKLLIEALIDMLNYKTINSLPDYNDVERMLSKYQVQKSTNHVNGMGILLATSALFVSNQDNFMVVDKPIMNYFNITTTEDAIQNYQNIIKYSKCLSITYGVNMWLVNKAYAVSLKGSIKIQPLCNCNFASQEINM
jgi:hypothetical protein